MSISYSGIVGYGKATLPSVESWSSNMNILRDPPKSITTRRVDRVGDTSEITQMIQESGDRACETIKVYARGVNPMVAVSYDNYGRNGGQNNVNNKTNSFLPYRVMRDGAFRPPIVDQRNLLPLSRLPRAWTSSFSQPGFADFSKKAMCPTENAKGAKKSEQMLKACIRPTATYKIATPVKETFEIKHVIKNPLHIEASAGINPNKKINAEVGKVYNNINQDVIKPDIHVNIGNSSINKQGENYLNTEKYIHDVLQGDITSNISRDVRVTMVENLHPNNSVKEQFTIDYTTPYKGYEKNEYINVNHELERRLPQHQAVTNIGANIHKNLDGQKVERQYTLNRPNIDATTNYTTNHQVFDNHIDREYRLKYTVSPGGMEALPTMPQVYREGGEYNIDTQKIKMNQRIYDMQSERNNVINNIPRFFD